jgi:hypothetical protein
VSLTSATEPHCSLEVGGIDYVLGVVSATVTKHLEFSVTFADGLSGRVTMLPSHLHGVFAPLGDAAIFNRLQVTDGFVSWPGEIDLAPDAM